VGRWKTVMFQCESCEFMDGMLFNLNEEEDDPTQTYDCPKCGFFTFSQRPYISAAGTNTSKTSQSIPDGVRKFSEIREKRSLERELTKAKRMKDKGLAADVRKEASDRKMVIKESH
jgi:hypothetical protein